MNSSAALKRDLAEMGAVAELGFNPDAAVAARIRAAAGELESLNPTDEPARAGALLRGRWRLLYSDVHMQRATTLSELSFGMLAKTPVSVTELFNEVDPATGLYDSVIMLLHGDGSPGSLVLQGAYEVEDDAALDIRFSDALVTGQGAPVRLPLTAARVPQFCSRITYLDESFRLARSTRGRLYILERLDTAPMLWARQYGD